MKSIGIAGGTGFVGRHLSALLNSRGYKVVIFTRRLPENPQNNLAYAILDVGKGTCDTVALRELDAIVNLAGAGVADKRWTVARKKEIVDSRVQGTDFLMEQVKIHAPRCKVFVAASATGFYGPDHTNSTPFTEIAPPANDFLGDTCRQWEAASQKAVSFLRTTILRFGIVLGKESGAFPEFVKPMSLGVVPILGSGKQIISWIEVDDLAQLILFALEHETMSGIYNAVTPNPVSHRQMMMTIAELKGGLKIPVPVPAVLLKMALGQLSEEVLKSCTVSADKTLHAGFTFNYPELTGAVKAILT